MNNITLCNYCYNPAMLTTGEQLYPKNEALSNKYYWHCEHCDANVGCHPGTTKPLGNLANAKLRRLRKLAHISFDKIWKNNNMSRNGAYNLLARKLGIDEKSCHIAKFDIKACKQTISFSNYYNKTMELV